MALVLLVNAPALAQSSGEKSWLEAIPASSRDRLLKRLKLYIEYERKREYEKLYDLYSESTLKVFNHEGSVAKTKGAYIKWRQTSYPILLKFEPLSAAYNSTLGEYEIRGQAKLRWKGGVGTQEMYINAVLKNNEWYLSQLLERTEERYSSEPIKAIPIQIIESLPPQ